MEDLYRSVKELKRRMNKMPRFNNTNGQQHLTLRMMLEEVLDKQKYLVDGLRSVEKEIQLIRDDMKPKTVTAAVPVRADSKNTIDSDSENKSSTMPTTGKCFVLKYVFKNVSNMKEDDIQWSKPEEYYGVKWRMKVCRSQEHVSFFLKCLKLITGKWSIGTQLKYVLLSKSTGNRVKECGKTYGTMDTNNGTWGWPLFIEWAVLEKDFLVNDQLTGEIHVKIKKTTGIYKDNLRSFDKTMEEFSDVVLIVNEEKFFVSKLYLAAHSPYFKVLFLGNFSDSKNSEIKLTGIDADDFQKYLEILYGESAIDEFTVEGILMVADMYDTPLVIRKCEEFLLKESKKTFKKKLELSTRYNLEALKKKCLADIKSIADLQAVLPENVQDLDKSTMGELLEKSISLHS